jgi:hypothetical protein
MITAKKKQWLEEYRQRNKVHIAKVAKAKYIRNRDKYLIKVHEWRMKNMDKVNAGRKRQYDRNPELMRIRAKTRHHFGSLKKTSRCQICGASDRLEFHHTPPFKYDIFIIVCHDCHRELEGRIVVRSDGRDLITGEQVK